MFLVCRMHLGHSDSLPFKVCLFTSLNNKKTAEINQLLQKWFHQDN